MRGIEEKIIKEINRAKPTTDDRATYLSLVTYHPPSDKVGPDTPVFIFSNLLDTVAPTSLDKVAWWQTWPFCTPGSKPSRSPSPLLSATLGPSAPRECSGTTALASGNWTLPSVVDCKMAASSTRPQSELLSSGWRHWQHSALEMDLF